MTHHRIESLEQRTLLSAQLIAGADAAWGVASADRGAIIEDDATLAGRPGGGGGNGGGGGGGSTANPAIAFVTGNGDLKVMNADGSNQKSIWRGGGASQPRFPTWHPDGEHILFYSQTQGHGLYRINIEGTGLTKVISLNTGTITSEISPLPGANGLHRIVFWDNDSSGVYSLFVANEDGSGRTQLTFGGADLYPTWSPNGQQIAYAHWDSATNPPAPGSGLRLMTLGEDASGNIAVVDDVLLVPYHEEFQGVTLTRPYHPSFSKTQAKIYFHAAYFAPTPPFNSNDIWSWDVSASQLRQITDTPDVTERFVSGSADDSRIVYEISGTLYTANSDGSGRLALPKAKGEKNVAYLDPAFKRAPVAAPASSSTGGAELMRPSLAPRVWSATPIGAFEQQTHAGGDVEERLTELD